MELLFTDNRGKKSYIVRAAEARDLFNKGKLFTGGNAYLPEDYPDLFTSMEEWDIRYPKHPVYLELDEDHEGDLFCDTILILADDNLNCLSIQQVLEARKEFLNDEMTLETYEDITYLRIWND